MGPPIPIGLDYTLLLHLLNRMDVGRQRHDEILDEIGAMELVGIRAMQGSWSED